MKKVCDGCKHEQIVPLAATVKGDFCTVCVRNNFFKCVQCLSLIDGEPTVLNGALMCNMCANTCACVVCGKREKRTRPDLLWACDSCRGDISKRLHVDSVEMPLHGVEETLRALNRTVCNLETRIVKLEEKVSAKLNL
jgi:hypothetical protein